MGVPAIDGGTFARPDLRGRVSVVTGAVTELGGRGVAVRLDHRDDDEVRAFFEQVGVDEGRIDILVGNATGNDYHGDKTIRAMYSPVWMKPLGWWDANHGVGVRSNFVMCRYGLPHMVGRPSLVVLTSEPITHGPTHPDPVYDLRAHATHRMARTFGEQLKDQQVAMVCLVPGDVQTHSRRQGHEDEPIPAGGETVHLAGRAVASLAADPQVLRHAGASLRVAECADAYGFTDAVDD